MIFGESVKAFLNAYFIWRGSSSPCCSLMVFVPSMYLRGEAGHQQAVLTLPEVNNPSISVEWKEWQ